MNAAESVVYLILLGFAFYAGGAAEKKVQKEIPAEPGPCEHPFLNVNLTQVVSDKNQLHFHCKGCNHKFIIDFKFVTPSWLNNGRGNA